MSGGLTSAREHNRLPQTRVNLLYTLYLKNMALQH